MTSRARPGHARRSLSLDLQRGRSDARLDQIACGEREYACANVDAEGVSGTAPRACTSQKAVACPRSRRLLDAEIRLLLPSPATSRKRFVIEPHGAFVCDR